MMQENLLKKNDLVNFFMQNPFNLSVLEMKKMALKIRRHCLEMTTAANSGHPGGSLSATELGVALYFNKLKFDLKNSKNPGRDRFILSKGHCTPLLYALLAEIGWLPKDELKTFRKINSRLQGHPHYGTIQGIETSSGSLGMGLAVGNGIALSARLDKRDFRVFAMLGDGELQEGNVWEAVMAAGHYKLNNLIAIVDSNNLQIDGKVSDIMGVEPIVEKFAAFGWNSIEIDGHNFEQILKALDFGIASKEKPTAIIAKTVKGKGVSFMEHICDFHGKALTLEELAKALKELEVE